MDIQSTNCTKNLEEKNYWWQKADIVVPIISLLLTPILSCIVALLVVNFQLSREHNFANNQVQSARERTKINQKIQLHSKTIKLMGTTSNLRLTSAVTHLYATIELKYLLDGLENYRNVYNQSVKKFSDIILETQKDYSELRATLEIARFYFSIETQNAINDFLNFYSSNPSILMPKIEEIIVKFQYAKQNGISDISIVTQLEKQLNSIMKDDKYIKLGHKITNAMMNEIAANLKLAVLRKDQISHNQVNSTDSK